MKAEGLKSSTLGFLLFILIEASWLLLTDLKVERAHLRELDLRGEIGDRKET